MSTIDITVLIIFLAFTLAVGTWAGKGISTIESYAVGNRNYNTFALFATLSASYIGGGYTFGLSEKVFTHGIFYSFCLFGFSVQQIFVSQFVAPRMGAFTDSISVGDIMGKLYGKYAQIITGVCSVIVCAGILGAQVGATGYVFNLFLGIDRSIGILIGCGIVLIYSVVGGIRAVIATDILQFFILIVMIPVTLVFGLIYIWDPSANVIVSSINTTPIETLSTSSMIALFLSLLFGEALVAPYVQRLLVTKTLKQTERGILYSGLMSIPFFFITGFIGLVAFKLSPELDANLSLPYVIQTVLPDGIKGLAVASIIAVIMSSADSYLNASSIGFVHDILGPLRKKTISLSKELSITRMTTFFIGILAIVFATSIESVLDLLLYSYNFWAPIILIPLVMGILKFKLSFKGFLASSLVGAISVVCWNVLLADSTGIEGLIIGVMANGITFYVLYILESRKKTILQPM